MTVTCVKLVTVCIYILTLTTIPVLGLPPIISVQPPSDVIYKDLDKIVLQCRANNTTPGINSVHYYWKKNGEVVDAYNQYMVTPYADQGTLIIREASANSQGVYQCFAENQEGTSVSQVSNVRQAVLTTHPDHNKVTRFTVFKGVSFNLTCLASKCFPEAEFYWEVTKGIGDQEQSARVRLDNRVQQDKSGGLYFAHAKMTDGGVYYRCVIFNSFLQQKVYSSYSHVTVNTAPRTYVRPKLVYSDPSWQKVALAVTGRSVALQCIFDGYPSPVVSWRRGSGLLMPMKRYSVLHHGSVLKIMNVTEEDAGNYSCTGTVTDGDNVYKDVHTVKVVVQSEPSFRTPNSKPVSLNVTEGATAKFVCDVTGNPKPRVQWFINSVSIHDLTNHRLSLSVDRSTLTLSKACSKCEGGYFDIGVIQCNASNKHGYVYGEAYLNVVPGVRVLKVPVEINEEETKEMDNMSFSLRIGTIVGATVIVSVVIFIVAVIYCKSKQLEKELKHIKSTTARRHRPPHRYYQDNNNHSNSVNIPNTVQNDHHRTSDGKYEKIGPLDTGGTILTGSNDNLQPGSYQHLIREEENEEYIDGPYKYDYAYEDTPQTLLFNMVERGSNTVDKGYSDSRPSSTVHAYVDVIGTEEWDNLEVG